MTSHTPLTPTIQNVLDRLRGVKKHRARWTAFCPRHDDRNERSLGINVGDDGRILLKCYAGCEIEDVVKAIGLTMRDLFPQPIKRQRKEGRGPATPESAGATLNGYADFKRLPIEFLRSVGLSDGRYGGNPAVRIPHRAPDGREMCVQYRRALEKSDDGDERFRWESGAKLILYGLDRLKSAVAVTAVEGASDCHTLSYHGVNCVGLPGAGNWNEERDASHFDGFETIYVVIERDNGGEAVKRWLSQSVIRHRVRLVDLGEFKDPSEMHIDDPDLFQQRWERALADSVPWFDADNGSTSNNWHRTPDSKIELVHDFQDVMDAFRRYFVMNDTGGVRLVVALVAAHSLIPDPVWLFLVAPPSSLKTELIRALRNHRGTHSLSDLTSKTLVSGLEGKKDPSLLLHLKNDILLMKDFTTVISKRHEERQEILSQLREIHDGYFSKVWGNGKRVDWSGHLGFIAGVTPIIDTQASVTSVMGERFLNYRFDTPDREIVALQAQRNSGQETEIRQEIKQTVQGFLYGLAVPDALPDTSDFAIRTGALANFVSLARSGIVRDGYSREITYIPEPEGPARIVKQLTSTLAALGA